MLPKQLDVLHAVEQRDDQCAADDVGRKAIQCIRELRRLDRHQADIDRFGQPFRGRDRRDEVAEPGTLDADA
jgi:hypothetical protein